MTKKKFSAKQIAAQKKFAAASKAGTLKKGSKLKTRTLKATGKKGGKKGGGRTAAKKKNGNGKKKQGVMSWATNVIAMGIGFSNVAVRIAESLAKPEGEKMEWFSRTMLSDHAGMIFGPGMEYAGFEGKRLIRGYAPIVGAVGFKIGMMQLQKRAPIRSLIPGR